MKKISILLALVLVASLASFAMASGPRTTGFQIQNLGANPANVTVTYYNGDGTVRCTEDLIGANAIPVGGAAQFYQGVGSPYSDCIGSDGTLTEWRGSVVIESTEPVAVVANIAESTNPAAGAYVGTSSTLIGQPLILPGIFSGNTYGFTGDFAIQNTTDTQTTVDIRFYGSVGGTGASTLGKEVLGVAIPKFASYYFDMETGAAPLPNNWIGVAVVTPSNGAPLAGTINQKPVGSAAGALFTYDGVAADKIPASANMSLPGLMKNFFNYWTGVQVIASANGTAGSIKIFESGNPTAVHTEPFSLNQWESKALFVKDLGLSNNVLYFGTVEFTSGAGASIVNQRDFPGVVGMTNSGIYTANTTPNLSLPFVARNFWGVSTGFAIKNDGTAGTIDVHFDGQPGTGSGNFSISNYALGAGASLNLFQWKPGCTGDCAVVHPNITGCAAASCGTKAAPYPEKWTGSVRVIGDAGMLLSSIVNERGYEQGIVGDVGQVYNGFNY